MGESVRLRITINNWDRINPTHKVGDIWLRFDKWLPMELKMKGFSVAVRWVYVCLLTLQCGREEGYLDLTLCELASYTDQRQTRLRPMLDQLQTMLMVQVVEVIHSCAAQTDRQTEYSPNTGTVLVEKIGMELEEEGSPSPPKTSRVLSGSPIPPVLNPESGPEITHLICGVTALYSALYPRKEGRTRGVARIVRTISPNELPDLERAITNYAASVKGRETKYIKLFSTFASEWRDWINPETTCEINPNRWGSSDEA